MLKIYIIGVCILITAIIANAVVVKIGLKSWYDVIELLGTSGIDTFRKLRIWDYLWLLIGYPMVLGGGYYIGLKLYDLL